jgi:hypothetical protein
LPGFIGEHIRSVWALELLLRLKREPDRRWRPDDLVRELRASTSLVADNLQRFERGGFVIVDSAGEFRYAPASPVLADLAEVLERAYRERPVAIINLIAAPPDPIQGLADAFRFRGDKP